MVAKKRNNNTGSVYPDKQRGGWRAMITLEDGRRISKRFPGPDEELAKEQANNWLTEQLYNQSKGIFVAPSEITVGEWLVEFLRLYAKPKVRKRTFEGYLYIAKHCEPIAALPLQSLRPSVIQKFYQQIKDNTGEIRRKVHVILGSALKQAIHDRLIQFNPMDGVATPKVTKKEIEIFPKEEIENILAAAKGHLWYPSLLLAAHTGMRLGEILGLRWKDVDFDDKSVFVKQTLQHSRDGIIFEEPKTKSSKRKIAIPADTAELLRQHRKQLIKAELRIVHDRLDELQQQGNVNTPEYKKLSDRAEDFFRSIQTRLCFTAGNGSPIQPRNYERWWYNLQRDCNQEYKDLGVERKEIRKKFGVNSPEHEAILKKQKEALVSRRKNFHALRHTHATELLASGKITIVDVSKRLGHATPSITLNFYGHMLPGNDEKSAEHIGKLYKLK